MIVTLSIFNGTITQVIIPNDEFVSNIDKYLPSPNMKAKEIMVNGITYVIDNQNPVKLYEIGVYDYSCINVRLVNDLLNITPSIEEVQMSGVINNNSLTPLQTNEVINDNNVSINIKPLIEKIKQPQNDSINVKSLIEEVKQIQANENNNNLLTPSQTNETINDNNNDSTSESSSDESDDFVLNTNLNTVPEIINVPVVEPNNNLNDDSESETDDEADTEADVEPVQPFDLNENDFKETDTENMVRIMDATGNYDVDKVTQIFKLYNGNVTASINALLDSTTS